MKKISSKIINYYNKVKYNLMIFKYIKCSKYFDKSYYKNTYKITSNPYKNYYEVGWKEGKNPSVYFDTNKYLAQNPDLLNHQLCPLYHYEKYGKKEGRKRFFVDSQYDENYKLKKVRRFIKRKISNIYFHKLIKQNQNTKILVYIHVFYIKSIGEIIEYLKNLEKYNYDLIISCTNNDNTAYIKNKFRSFKKDTKVFIFKNKGFDIGPFIEVLNKIDLNKYDILFKLQSKGTFNQTNFIYGQIFKNRDWFEYMFESTLGANFVHKNISLLKNDNKIGIIAADNLIIEDPKHKQNFTIKQLKKKNININPDYKFVAGTCYIEKICLAKKIKELNLSINDFEDSEKYYFSFAHAMERYLTNIDNKYIIYGNKVNRFKHFLWRNASKKIAAKSGIRIINIENINISDDFCLRFLEHSLIDNYKFEEIPLGQIKREYNNIQYPLKDCSPYLFLKGEKKRYIEYCLKNRRTDYMDMSEKEFKNKIKKECIPSYEALINTLNKTGYNEKYPIIVDQNNCILDGQHRACILLYKYGEDFPIKVLKLDVIKKTPKITKFMKKI